MGPSGKLPWIQYNDHVVSDSQACVDFLQVTCQVDINRNMTSRDKAVGHVVRRSVEEWLYWWVDCGGFGGRVDGL